MGNFFSRCKKESIKGPYIIFNYNQNQKRYILELIEKFDYNKPLKFILQPSENFSIVLHFNNNNYDIQKKTVEDSLNDIYKIIKSEHKYELSLSSTSINHEENEGGLSNLNGERRESKQNIESNEIRPIQNEKLERINENKMDIFRGSKYIRFTNDGIQKIEMQYKYGNILKKLINEEKISNPSKFIKINDSLKLENTNKELFALGLLAKVLEENGLKVVIEKDPKKNEEQSPEEKNEHEEILELIINRMYQKKKYILYFDFGLEKKSFLENSQKFEDFEGKIKLIIIRGYKISDNEIIVNALLQEENIIVNVIFLSNEFDNLDLNEFKSKLKGENPSDEMKYLQNISSDIIIRDFKLSKTLLDSKGNIFDNWPMNENKGWIGIGLKVMDIYDNGDNSWMEPDKNNNKWRVAYFRIGTLNKISKKISCDSSKQSYFSTTIKIAEQFADEIKINNKKYKILLMARIRGDTLENSKKGLLYFNISKVTNKIIRPYRILYKEVSKE